MATHLHGWESLDSLVSAEFLVLCCITVNGVERDEGVKAESRLAVLGSHCLAMLYANELVSVHGQRARFITYPTPRRNESDYRCLLRVD